MYSRLAQYLRQAMESWEKIRVIHDYRTPSALRSYALVWLISSSMILSPQWAKYSRDFGYMSGIYAAMVVSLMLSGLHQIFQNEEDPFDGRGIDDLSLDQLSLLTEQMYDRPRTLKKRLRVVERVEQSARDAIGARLRGKSQPALGINVRKERFVTSDLNLQDMESLRTQNPKLAGETRARFLYLDDGDDE
jgi:hypothetical protein